MRGRSRLPASTAALIAALLLSACAGTISREELQALLGTGQRPLLLDVRTEREYAQGHIPGAVNVSLFDFQSFETLAPPKDRPIVLICEHGPRAGFAGYLLKQAGYLDVRSLDGAMKAWRQQGLPVEK